MSQAVLVLVVGVVVLGTCLLVGFLVGVVCEQEREARRSRRARSRRRRVAMGPGPAPHGR